MRSSRLQLFLLLSAVGHGACSAGSSLPPEFFQDNEDLKRAVIVLNEARDLSNPLGSESGAPFQLPDSVEREIREKTEEGLRLGEDISHAFLEWVHPEMPEMFHDKLIRGTRLFYEGLRVGDQGQQALAVERQIAGNRLIMEWIGWLEREEDAVAAKVFGG